MRVDLRGDYRPLLHGTMTVSALLASMVTSGYPPPPGLLTRLSGNQMSKLDPCFNTPGFIKAMFTLYCQAIIEVVRELIRPVDSVRREI